MRRAMGTEADLSNGDSGVDVPFACRTVARKGGLRIAVGPKHHTGQNRNRAQ